MARGLAYTVTPAAGLRVKSLNAIYSQGQVVEIDPAFLNVCEELQGYIKSKLLVPITSEFRHGGPTGLVPSGDEIYALRRAQATGRRASVVVNNINLDRDQVVRDHLSGLDIKMLAREVAMEMGGRSSSNAVVSESIIERIAAKVLEMLPPAGQTDEDRIASKVLDKLLPAIGAIAAGSGQKTGGNDGVIEVEMEDAPLPDMTNKEDLQVHLGNEFGKTSSGTSIDDHVAAIERVLRQVQKTEEETDERTS